MFYLIKSHYKTLIRLSYGTTFLEITKKELGRILVLHPPLSEQTKIASILSGVDATIEATQKTIEKTEKLKKGLMQQLLTRGINHERFKKVKWRFGKEIEIPEEWEITTLANVCKVRNNSPIKSDLYIGLEHIEQHSNRLIQQGNIEEFTSNKNAFCKNDVLYGKLRPIFNKVLLVTEDGYCSTDIIPLQPDLNKINPQILLLILSSYRFFWYAVSTSAGTKMPRTKWADMKQFLVFCPELSEQTKIASILSGVDAYIQKNREYKENLEHLKKGLMQKLLTGQIRVKV